MRLIESLERIKDENLISFHMPGHKNGRLIAPNLLTYDITEIPGSDHLHDAQSCILETEKAISNFYNSDMSKILVNGSTVGILAMILGLTRPGDRVLINRNAHKSVYNAIEMNQLNPVYISPYTDATLGIPVDFDRDDFEKKLRDVKICLITYPTYEGLCFPVEKMIASCRKYQVPILIDEAHGAHLLLHENGPKSALDLGADVVVQSFHKTLPTLTQTSCLHFGQNHQLKPEQRERIIWYLKSLQSSSPSYVLMASIDYMIAFVEKYGVSYAQQLEAITQAFLERVVHVKTLKIMRFENQDITKLLLMIPTTYYIKGVWDGHQVDKLLREEYGIQVEYSADHYLLLMSSIATSESDFDQLAMAMCAMDDIGTLKNDIISEAYQSHIGFQGDLSYEREVVLLASDVYQYEKETIPVTESVGRVASEYIIPYPPGIPLVVPGERILACDIHRIQKEQTQISVLKSITIIK